VNLCGSAWSDSLRETILKDMRIPLVVFMLCCGSAAAATAYTWVDGEGVTHYSDRPRPGAERIELGVSHASATRPASAVTAGASPPPAARTEAAATSYGLCEIETPHKDEVLANAYSVAVSVRLEPRLRGSDTVTLVLDGQSVQGPVQATTFTISPIDRGTHTVAARVADASGAALCETPGITFHVRQPSLLQPNRRKR